MSGKAGHPAYFDPQTEKAFMKQDAIFANKKELLNKGSKRAPRSVSFSLSNIFVSAFQQCRYTSRRQGSCAISQATPLGSTHMSCWNLGNNVSFSAGYSTCVVVPVLKHCQAAAAMRGIYISGKLTDWKRKVGEVDAVVVGLNRIDSAEVWAHLRWQPCKTASSA